MLYLIMTAFTLSAVPSFSAVIEDDSVPYMPYPETPPQTQPAKTPAKKTTTKKKTPAKKPAPKKSTKKAAPKPAPKPSSLQQGIALMEQERYEQAKAYLLKAIQEDRNDPNAWYWYGVYHEKTGGFYQAQYFYTKAVTIDPAFEPLSRVVYYPEDSEKTPLWDPKRPARVYPVEVASTGGLSTVPAGRSSFPTAPSDPELPHVPVYTPPEPGAAPYDGDAWSPAVYVPPRPEEVQTEGEMSAVYQPPEPTSIVAQEGMNTRQVLELPVVSYPQGYEVAQVVPQRDDTLRADKPLYNPPKPGEKAPAVPKSTTSTATAKKQTTTTTTKAQDSTPKRTASVPANRVMRQNTKAKKTPASTTTTRAQRQPSRTASRDVRPQTQSQPQTPATRQTQPAPQTRTPEPVRTPEPEPVRQPSQQYMPPVGQYAPDPGTISEMPIPPVGQGNQY